MNSAWLRLRVKVLASHGEHRDSQEKGKAGGEVRRMVFNKQAALYGNVMNTVDKKKGETKVVKFQAAKELQSVFKCHIDFSSNL